MENAESPSDGVDSTLVTHAHPDHLSLQSVHEGRTLPAGDTAEAFDPTEFVARVIMPIPQPRRHLVRYYGWHSNVCRGKRQKAEVENGEVVGAGAGPAEIPAVDSRLKPATDLRRIS